jgi:hypothetical protein
MDLDFVRHRSQHRLDRTRAADGSWTTWRGGPRSNASAVSFRSLYSVFIRTRSEFLNYHLVSYCQGYEQAGERRSCSPGKPGAPILLSRSSPEHKNDNAHVEQKNWTLVRRLIGYQRLDTPEQLSWLDALYTELLRPYNNCFQPVMKLIRKESDGQRTRKFYDRPNQPLWRVLDSGAAAANKIAGLVELYTGQPAARTPE